MAGWRFLELGRRIERAILTCRFVRELAGATAPDGSLDVLLELCDSQMTYRQRYVMLAARAPVIDLVMLDPNNPRSVVYQLERIEAHLAALPKHVADGRLSPPQQIAASIATGLRTADAAKVERFGKEIAPLVTAGPPGVTGFAGGRPKPQEIVAYWPALLAREEVESRIEVTVEEA